MRREGRKPGIGRKKDGFEVRKKGMGLPLGNFRRLQNRDPMPMAQKLFEDVQFHSPGVS